MTRTDRADSFEDMVDPVAPSRRPRRSLGWVVIVIMLVIAVSLSAIGAVA